jgi:hypothetical protein
MYRSLPTADEPLRDGEPQPDSGAVRSIAAALEGLKPRSPIRDRDARAAVDHPQMDLDATAPASTRTADSGGDHAIALSMRFATALSRRAGSVSMRGNVSGCSRRRDRAARSPRLAKRGRHDLLDPTRA